MSRLKFADQIEVESNLRAMMRVDNTCPSQKRALWDPENRMALQFIRDVKSGRLKLSVDLMKLINEDHPSLLPLIFMAIAQRE